MASSNYSDSGTTKSRTGVAGTVTEKLMDRKLPSNHQKTPKSVWFIICDELCERFNYYGLRTILVLYLTSILNYSNDESTMIYHGFTFLSYFMPLFGAVLGDSYWGKYKTVIRLTIVYVLGNIILTGASMTTNFTLDTQRFVTFVGLVLISIGTGGIKPCVMSFGGDQFQLPEQQVQLSRFFNRFITAIYVGGLISTFLTPELRKSVPCFGRDTCYPLAFGVLSLLMITALVIFITGRKLYVMRKPENHVIFKTTGCILYGIRKKFTLPTSNNSHWLDHASKKYSKIEVSDTKAALEVLLIYIAYPIFWALFEQQGSRWTLQATLMDGKLKTINWEIQPDQMQTIFPFFTVLFILTLDSILYPFLAKFGIRRPLPKIIFSYFMAIVAFLLAAVLQHIIFGESTVIAATEGQFVVYNGFNCNVYVEHPQSITDDIGPLGLSNFKYEMISDEDLVNITLKFDSSCSFFIKQDKMNERVTISKGKSISYFLTPTQNNNVVLRRVHHYDDLTKPKNGHPILRIIIGDNVKEKELFALVQSSGKKYSLPYNVSSFLDGRFKEMVIGNYNLMHGERVISSDVGLVPATIYTLVIHDNDHDVLESKLYATDQGNYLHILWQTPQYTFMILADVLFVTTTIEFSFTQAPPRIKSLMSSCYSLTQSIGNLMIVIISALNFQKQEHEYLFFSGLMLVDTLLLIYLSYSYQYKNFKQRFDDDNVEENTSLSSQIDCQKLDTIK